MKDLFSDDSLRYKQARPAYSAEIVQEILKHVPERTFAWDCGAGSGQFTQLLTPHFQQILATDLSQAQLDQAPQWENVRYRACLAQDSGLADASVDLITVAQAIHWFKFDAFYAEVHRVLKPSGIFAAVGYGLIQAVDPEVNTAIQRLYFQTLKGCWDAERRYIDDLYRTIPFPFQEIVTPELCLKYRWSAAQLLNYLNTWSGLQHYLKQHTDTPLLELQQLLQQQPAQGLEIQFPVLLRLGRLV
jgi:ubiquinone/menaquinone biosynthesis C-methylase UbiE